MAIVLFCVALPLPLLSAAPLSILYTLLILIHTNTLCTTQVNQDGREKLQLFSIFAANSYFIILSIPIFIMKIFKHKEKLGLPWWLSG